MPLYDYECCKCGLIFESIQPIRVVKTVCESCGGVASRIISCGKCYTANEDTGWLKTVHEVIAKDTTNPVAKEFLKNPTRSNYKSWMKSENLRPLENNEPLRPPPTNTEKIRKEVWEKHKQRNRLSI